MLVAASAVLSVVPAQACLTAPAPVTPPPVQTPIMIKSDAEFATNPAVKGGSGTPGDPYRIENLELSVKTSLGLSISGTSAHFVVRNVTVRDMTDPKTRTVCCFSAMAFYNVENGSLEGLTVEGTQAGISLTAVRGVSVVRSTFANTKPGLSITDSTSTTVAGNTFTNSSFSFEASTAEQAGAHTIAPDNLLDGRPLIYHGNCNGLRIDGQVAGAFVIGNCTGVTINDLTVLGSGGSLRVLYSTNVAVNRFTGTTMEFANVTAAQVGESAFTNLSVRGFDDFLLDSSSTAPGGATWIVASAGTGLRIEGNEFHGRSNLLTLGGYSGPWCYCMGPPPPAAVASAIVANNTLEGTGGTAITLAEAPAALITGNRVLNYSLAVDLGANPGVIVDGNTLVGESGIGIRASGLGVAIRHNTVTGFNNGIELGPAVEATGNEIHAVTRGISVGDQGAPLATNNTMVGGSVVVEWGRGYAWGDASAPFVIGANNTVNGLPVAFHHGGSGLVYEGAELGQLIVMDYENVTLANLSFRDISFPLLVSGVMNLSVENLEVENASLGVELRSVWVGRIAHSRFNNTWGVGIEDAINLTIEENVLTNGSAGFRLQTVAGVAFSGNRIESLSQAPLALFQAYELTLRGNEFVGGGLDLYGAAGEDFTTYDIDGSNTVDGEPLLYLRNLEGLTLENLTLGELILANCTGTKLTNLQVRSEGPGVILAFVVDLSISNLTVETGRNTAFAGWNVDGLEMADSTIIAGQGLQLPYGYGAGALAFANANNLTIRDTNATGVVYYPGLVVEGGSQLTVRGGSFQGGWYGAMLTSVDTTVIDGAQFWGTYGGLMARSLWNANITNSSFAGGGGLWLDGLLNSRIEDNDLTGAESAGLGVSDSSHLVVASNRLHGSPVGISLYDSLEEVTVARNTMIGNGEGIYLDLKGGNLGTVAGVSIVNNTVEGNAVGVRGNASAGVQIYHNRFLNNTVQARVSPGAAWDAGYLVGGNFWSDYVGKDECSGQNQDVCPDPDEFGDTPYCLGAPSGASEAIDRYPLMNETPPPARDPPPYVPPPPAPQVPGVLDPTAAGLTGVALLLGVVGTATLLAAHLRSRRNDEAEDDEAGPGV